MIVLGEKEVAENTVSVRKQGEGDLGSMKTEEFAQLINDEINEKLTSLD